MIPTILIPCKDLTYSPFYEKSSIEQTEMKMKKKEMKKQLKLPDSKYLKRRYVKFGSFGSFGSNESKRIEQSPQKRTWVEAEDELKTEQEAEQEKVEIEETEGQKYSFTECKMDGIFEETYPKNPQEYSFSTIEKNDSQGKCFMEKRKKVIQYSFSECSLSTSMISLHANSTMYTFSECLSHVC